MATLASYQKMTVTQRNRVNRDDLKKLLDESLDADVSEVSLRNLITETINQSIDAKLTTIKEEIKNELKNEMSTMNTDIDGLRSTVGMLKLAVLEQQKYLERSRFESCRNNAFITGLPCTMEINGAQSNDADAILCEALKVAIPDITKEAYKVIKNFPPREGMTRHSAKIVLTESDTKKKLMDASSKYKDLKKISDTHVLQKVFVRNDQPPLTRKENDRLRTKMWVFRDADEENLHSFRILKGVLYKDDVEIDRFNLSNQLF